MYTETKFEKKKKITDNLEDLSLTKAKPKTGKSLDEKALQTLMDGFTVKVLESGHYELTIKRDERRCYKVDIR